MKKMKAQYVTSRQVCCSGGAVGGHPKVYLNMGDKNQIACNYCGQVFILEPSANGVSADAGH